MAIPKRVIARAAEKAALKSDAIAQMEARIAAKRKADNMALFEEFEAEAPAGPDFSFSKVEAETHQLTKEKALFDPTYDLPNLAYLNQTETPEDFARRYVSQLQDPNFSTKAVFQELNKGGLDDLLKWTDEHNGLVDRIWANQSQNPRWVQSVKEYQKDSPYAGDIFFHTDRFSDPVRGSTDFIQYSDPKEMGVHLGTEPAARRFYGFAGGNSMDIKHARLFADSIDQFAGMVDMTPRELHLSIGRAIRQQSERVFSKGGFPGSSLEFQDLLIDIEQRLQGMGAPDGEVTELLQKLTNTFSDIASHATPNLTPAVFRGKNGLYIPDGNNFTPGAVATYLEDIYPDDADEILAAAGAGTRQEVTKKLQQFIESKGFDHIIYHNAVEGRGTLSIINWNPDLMESIWSPALNRDNPGKQAEAYTSFIMGALGLGEVLEEE